MNFLFKQISLLSFILLVNASNLQATMTRYQELNIPSKMVREVYKFTEQEKLTIEDILNALEKPGKLLENFIKNEIIRALRDPKMMIFFDNLFEKQRFLKRSGQYGTISIDTKGFAEFVFPASDGHFSWVLHVHWRQGEESEQRWQSYGAFLYLNSVGQIESPIWVELNTSVKLARTTPEWFYEWLELIQAPIDIENMPSGFIDDLNDALNERLTYNWQVLLLPQVKPRDDVIIVEPLLTHPETWRIFREQMALDPAFRELVREKMQSPKHGPVKIKKGILDLEQRYGFPLVMRGPLRRILTTEGNDTNPDTYFRELTEADDFFKGALVLSNEDGNPFVYFDRGLAWVPLGTSFEGRPELLKQMVVRLINLSDDLIKIIKPKDWPPRFLKSKYKATSDTLESFL